MKKQIPRNIIGWLVFALILVNSMVCYSCFQSEKNNSQEKTKANDSITKERNFLSQKALLNYRDNAKTNEFHINSFGLHDSLKFNKVIAYDFDGSGIQMEGEDDESTVLVGKNNFSKRIKKQEQLSLDEIEILLTMFTSKEYFGGLSALCFSPKLGFIFYNNSEVVNVIDICLDCNDFKLYKPPN